MKKILFFSPSFFGYEKAIVSKLIELGYEVDFFDERSITKSVEKALFKVMPSLYKKKTEQYYEVIFQEIKDKSYDILLFIKADSIPTQSLQKLKHHFSNAKFYLYLWDSIRNINNIEKKFKYFDEIYSFDKEDVSNNALLKFRPLFYTDEYKKAFQKKEQYKYDLSFCGTIHSDRYKIIKNIDSFCRLNNLNVKFYNFLQGDFMYYFYKFTKREFLFSPKNNFDFEKISSSEISEIVDNSRAILDIQHPSQTGLTMRTIEMIGMQKKIITTNKDIVEYDFYNPNNILVIDRKKPIIPLEFFSTEYAPIPNEIYNSYSLESWIRDILD